MKFKNLLNKKKIIIYIYIYIKIIINYRNRPLDLYKKKQISIILYLFIKLCLIHFLSVILLVRHYKKKF